MSGSKAADDGCVFCKAAEASGAGRAPDRSDADNLTVFAGRTCFIVLNLYPYNNGHLMVVPFRHVASLAGLKTDELQELALLTQRSEVALTEAYQPHGLNVGINLGKPAGAGVLDHVHVHLVPRWSGDTNFMTVVGEVRVLPEDLHESAKRLRPIFERIATKAAERCSHEDGLATKDTKATK